MSLFDTEPRRPEFTLWNYRWRPGAKNPPLLPIGAILLFVGSLFLIIGGAEARKQHRLGVEGKVTTATVIKKTLNKASDDRDSSTSYGVDCRFIAADGRVVEGNDTVGPDAWDRLKEGGPVQIQYAASEPRINQIGVSTGISGGILIILGVGLVVWLPGAALALKGLFGIRPAPNRGGEEVAEEDSVEPGKVKVELSPFLARTVGPWGAFGGILLVVGGILLLIGLANLRQERAFKAEGKIATGIVLTKRSHEEYHQQNNTRETHYELSYRFPTAEGKSVEGSQDVSWRVWRSIQERDPIQIIYLPKHPERNRLASQNPRILLSIMIMLGALLSGGGTALLGYGLFASVLGHNARGGRPGKAA